MRTVAIGRGSWIAIGCWHIRRVAILKITLVFPQTWKRSL
jgi:hypothetical protein